MNQSTISTQPISIYFPLPVVKVGNLKSKCCKKYKKKGKHCKRCPRKVAALSAEKQRPIAFS